MTVAISESHGKSIPHIQTCKRIVHDWIFIYIPQLYAQVVFNCYFKWRFQFACVNYHLECNELQQPFYSFTKFSNISRAHGLFHKQTTKFITWLTHTCFVNIGIHVCNSQPGAHFFVLQFVLRFSIGPHWYVINVQKLNLRTAFWICSAWINGNYINASRSKPRHRRARRAKQVTFFLFYIKPIICSFLRQQDWIKIYHNWYSFPEEDMSVKFAAEVSRTLGAFCVHQQKSPTLVADNGAPN